MSTKVAVFYVGVCLLLFCCAFVASVDAYYEYDNTIWEENAYGGIKQTPATCYSEICTIETEYHNAVLSPMCYNIALGFRENAGVGILKTEYYNNGTWKNITLDSAVKHNDTWWYKKGITFAANETKRVRHTVKFPFNSSGKFDNFVWRCSDNITEALSNGKYILLDPWWNISYFYRLPINITEISGSNLTDYQINFTVNTAAIIAMGHMQNDCDDIIFKNNTSIGNITQFHWLHSGCNTGATRFYVNVSYIPASSNRTIWMYYGNPTGVNVSNYSLTMTKNTSLNGAVDIWHIENSSPTGTWFNDSQFAYNNASLPAAPAAPTWVGEDGGQWDNEHILFDRGDSATFDGINDYADPDNRAFTDTQDYSIGIWYNGSDAQAGVAGLIPIGWMDNNDGSTNKNMGMKSGYPSLAFHNGTWQETNSSVFCADNLWHNIIFVNYYNTTCEFYVDGQPTNVPLNCDGDDASGHRFWYFMVGVTTVYLEGTIDEARVYYSALNGHEVKCLYERRQYAWPEPLIVVGAEEGRPATCDINITLPNITNSDLYVPVNITNLGNGTITQLNYTLNHCLNNTTLTWPFILDYSDCLREGGNNLTVYSFCAPWWSNNTTTFNVSCGVGGACNTTIINLLEDIWEEMSMIAEIAFLLCIIAMVEYVGETKRGGVGCAAYYICGIFIILFALNSDTIAGDGAAWLMVPTAVIGIFYMFRATLVMLNVERDWRKVQGT